MKCSGSTGDDTALLQVAAAGLTRFGDERPTGCNSTYLNANPLLAAFRTRSTIRGEAVLNEASEGRQSPRLARASNFRSFILQFVTHASTVQSRNFACPIRTISAEPPIQAHGFCTARSLARRVRQPVSPHCRKRLPVPGRILSSPFGFRPDWRVCPEPVDCQPARSRSPSIPGSCNRRGLHVLCGRRLRLKDTPGR